MSASFLTLLSAGTPPTPPGPRVDPVTEGLEGLWLFREGTGQIAEDQSINSNDFQLGVDPGVDANDPDWVANGLSFPTATALCLVPSPPSGLMTDAFTLCAVVTWARGTSLARLINFAAAGKATRLKSSFSDFLSTDLGNGNVKRWSHTTPIDLTDSATQFHFLCYSAVGVGVNDIELAELRVDGSAQQVLSTTNPVAVGVTSTQFLLQGAGEALVTAFLSYHSRVLSASEKVQMRDYARQVFEDDGRDVSISLP